MRLLFFNEGNLGANILGQAQLEATLRGHATEVEDLQTRFVTLPPQGRLARAAAFKTTPWLSATHLDLGTLRWHAVQSTRTRRATGREGARFKPDVMHVHSHSIALGLGKVMRSTPVAVSVDASIGDWAAMPAWRRTDRVEPLELGPTLAAERRTPELLVPHGDRPALPQAVLSLIDDPGRRAQLGAAARRRCELRFDAARQTPELLRVLRDPGERG